MDSFGFSSVVVFIQFSYSPPCTNQLSKENDLFLFGAILCDGIWKLRNQVIFEGLSFRCYELISRFWKLFMEFKFLRLDAISFVNTNHTLERGFGFRLLSKIENHLPSPGRGQSY